MTLTHLSLYRCKSGSGKDAVPAPRPNDVRASLYRLHMASPRHNTHDWQRLRDERKREQYAREAMADSWPSTDDFRA